MDRGSLPSAATDMEHIDSLLSLYNAIDHAINMRLATIQQMPSRLVLRDHGTPVGMFFQTKDRSFKTFVPSKS